MSVVYETVVYAILGPLENQQFLDKNQVKNRQKYKIYKRSQKLEIFQIFQKNLHLVLNSKKLNSNYTKYISDKIHFRQKCLKPEIVWPVFFVGLEIWTKLIQNTKNG
jgi:hypothetical protein